MSSETEIHPFRVDVPDEAIADLRRRIAATRWPSRELVADRSQGVQLASITELLGVIGPLTDPAAHGGSASDAFDLVLPSLPGYGFSAEPAEVGWDPGRIARAWAELMRRLGYTRYVAQGGDQGAAVTDAMGRQAPAGLAGIHMNLLVTALGGGAMPAQTEAERAALEQTKTFRATGFGYFLEQATRPQTSGDALLDSPLALAAWMLDHDTDAYYKISRAFTGGQP